MGVLDGTIFDGNDNFINTLEKYQSGEKVQNEYRETIENLRGFNAIHSSFLGVCHICEIDCYTLNFDYLVEHPNCYTNNNPTSLKELVIEADNLGVTKGDLKEKMLDINGPLVEGNRTLEEIHKVWKSLKESDIIEVDDDDDDEYNF